MKNGKNISFYSKLNLLESLDTIQNFNYRAIPVTLNGVQMIELISIDETCVTYFCVLHDHRYKASHLKTCDTL